MALAVVKRAVKRKEAIPKGRFLRKDHYMPPFSQLQRGTRMELGTDYLPALLSESTVPYFVVAIAHSRAARYIAFQCRSFGRQMARFIVFLWP
jgi:hypothetical protein